MRLWSAIHVKRYYRIHTAVKTVKTAIISPRPFSKTDLVSGSISEKNEKLPSFSFLLSFLFVFLLAAMLLVMLFPVSHIVVLESLILLLSFALMVSRSLEI